MNINVGDTVYSSDGEYFFTRHVKEALQESWESNMMFEEGCLYIYKGIVSKACSSKDIEVGTIEKLTFEYKYPDLLTEVYLGEIEVGFDDFELIESQKSTKPTNPHKGLPVEVYNDNPIPCGEDLMAAVRDFCDGV